MGDSNNHSLGWYGAGYLILAWTFFMPMGIFARPLAELTVWVVLKVSQGLIRGLG